MIVTITVSLKGFGLNINTPIDLELQNIATTSLRDGLILYDKRKGKS